LRKVFLFLTLWILTLNARPLYTLSAEVFAPNDNHLAIAIPCKIPLEDSGFTMNPQITIGYGLPYDFDASLYFNLYMNYSGGKPATVTSGLTDPWIEGRYKLISTKHFTLTPVLDISIPLTGNISLALGPGLMSSVNFSNFSCHFNASSAFSFYGERKEIKFLLTPELEIFNYFFVYIETKAFLNLNTSDKTPQFDIFPGVSYSPLYWLTITGNIGFSPKFDNIIPGIAVHVDV